MGKVRRQRKKLHLEAKTAPKKDENVLGPLKPSAAVTPNTELLIKPQDNLFANLNIDINLLKKNLLDDVQSVKSFKSVKSGSGKVLSKKDKLKLRREMLLQKFDLLNQQKQERKKKKNPVVGNLDPLRDALPSLESLLKSRGNVPYKSQQPKKKRGIEKAKTIKKNQLQGIKIFQKILKNKNYLKDPQNAVSQHVKAVLDHEKNS